jgi:hypothetical protein
LLKNIRFYLILNYIFIYVYIYTKTGLTEEERIELAALVEEEERLEREALMTEKEVETEVVVETTADLDVSNVCDEKVQDTSINEIEKVEDEKSVEEFAGQGKSVVKEISMCDNTKKAVITEMIVEEITTGLSLKEGNDVIEIEGEEETKKEEDGKKEEEGEIEKEGEKKEEEGERGGIKSVSQEPAVVETVFNTTEIAPGQYKSTTFENQNSVVVKEVVAELQKEVVAELQKEVVAEEMMNLSTNSISVTVDNLYGFQDQDDDITMENEVNPMTNYIPPPPYPNPAPPRLSFISMENPLKMKQNTAPKNTPDRINDPFPAPVPVIIATTNMAANPNPTFFDVNMGGLKTNTDDEWDVDLLASSPVPVKVRNPCF